MTPTPEKAMTDLERYKAALEAIAQHVRAQEGPHICQFCLWVAEDALAGEWPLEHKI